MAVTFNPNTADFSKELVREANQAIFTEAYGNATLTDIHEIVQDIKVSKQIVFVGGLSNMLGKGTNECNTDESTNAIPMSQKVWTPADVSDRLSFCWKALEDTFWAYALKTGVEKADVSEALLEMIYRIAHFNDTAADNVSGGGVITNGTDLAYFNKIDGIWKQLFSIVGADADRLTDGVIDTRNQGASYAAQKFDSTDTANMEVSKQLQEMSFEADERLTAMNGVQIIVTKSIGDQYKRELTRAGLSYSTERLENGMEMLKSDGLEVLVFSLWDRIIKAYEDNGTTYNLPHRALMTVKENIPIGTADAMSFGEFDVFYDKTEKKTFVDIATTIDAKVLEDHLVQVAY